MAAAAVEAHCVAVLVDLQAVAIELRFMQPAVAGGHRLGEDGATGLDEAEFRHCSGCSGILLAGQLIR